MIDEAHLGRNPLTMTAAAMWAIPKRHGLCLTGTPAQVKILRSNNIPLLLITFTPELSPGSISSFCISQCHVPKHRRLDELSAKDLLQDPEGTHFVP